MINWILASLACLLIDYVSNEYISGYEFFMMTTVLAIFLNTNKKKDDK
jgi:hypothetical protein